MEGGEARPTRALKESQHSEPWRDTLVRNRPAVGKQQAKRDEKNLPAQKQARSVFFSLAKSAANQQSCISEIGLTRPPRS